MWKFLLVGLACFLLLGVALPQPTATERATVTLNGHHFTLPQGFTIELAAPVGLVPRPITADFDEQGRLYVADSSGSNDKVADQLAKRPHRILRLDGKDGKYDRATVFADRMMFPEGTLWHDGSLYVAAPPSIWKLTDTNGDGVADERSEWFQGKTLTGCANDLHGPYLGPDGWIYWCKGAFALQTIPTGRGKGERTTRASHIFRCRPDGSGLESVMAGGMDNPVDVVFLPDGDRVFTTTFFQHPGGGLRDGLIHAVHGGLYGKVHDVLNDHTWTGPSVLPVLTHMGAAAPCGLACYESTSFGEDYVGNVFACQFNLRKVSRHILVREGSTYTTKDEDFLVSDHLDFHPTDVIEDADGSLIVVDTGGWYKLCCPTSQLDKPDVHGAIYRVRRVDAPKVDDPRGLKVDRSEPEKRLDDPRPVLRKQAIAALAATKTLPEVMGSPLRRRNALWTLTRIDSLEARSRTRAALTDPDENVRHVALHGISLWRDARALPALLRVLHSGTPADRRMAAECLGRIGDPAAVAPLLQAASRAEDRFLEHAITYALIEIEAPDAIKSEMSPENPKGLRLALVALDRLGKLPVATVLKQLQTNDASLKEHLLWIAGRHPEWGADLAGWLREQLASSKAGDEVRNLLTRFARSEAIQKLLVEELTNPSAPRPRRSLILRAMAESGLKETPETWLIALVDQLGSAKVDLPEVVSALRAQAIPKGKAGKVIPALVRIGEAPAVSVETRLLALSAVPEGVPEVSGDVFEMLRKSLAPEKPVRERALAVEVCNRARFTPEQLLALTESLRTVSPLEIDRLLEAFSRGTEERVGLALLAALDKSPAFGGLRIDMIRPRLAKYPASVTKAAEGMYARIDADAAKQKEKLDEMMKSLPAGDVRRGQVVFHSQKTACIACHALGYLGGKIGPDLTRIGTVRSERDLLESILAPSASLVRSYEPILLHTTAGKVHNGLIRRETPDEIELVVGAEQTVRIPRGDIEEIQPSKVSVMPAGLERILSPQELSDLVAFLKSRK